LWEGESPGESLHIQEVTYRTTWVTYRREERRKKKTEENSEEEEGWTKTWGLLFWGARGYGYYIVMMKLQSEGAMRYGYYIDDDEVTV
jgi:hypothetical protein